MCLGISLYLSLIMAMIAVIRMAGVRLDGDIADIVWACFWQQQECSIAVIMISVSAFRSFFVASSSKDSPGQPSKPWKLKLSRKYWNMDDSAESNTHGLPQIPSATMTGMRTFIAGAGAEAAEFQKRVSEKRLRRSLEPLGMSI